MLFFALQKARSVYLMERSGLSCWVLIGLSPHLALFDQWLEMIVTWICSSWALDYPMPSNASTFLRDILTGIGVRNASSSQQSRMEMAMSLPRWTISIQVHGKATFDYKMFSQSHLGTTGATWLSLNTPQ